MGTVELIISEKTAWIKAAIVIYGSAASEQLAKQLESETAAMWNEPNGQTFIDGVMYQVKFEVPYVFVPLLDSKMVTDNKNPNYNFIRIEDYLPGNISFVDGLGANTGCYMTENLYEGSTTAAHEFGHMLGLPHPDDNDLRGKGIPGIMYARGTIVDQQYQYDIYAQPGAAGGTMHPKNRKVQQFDIDHLNLAALNYIENKAVIGDFTNIFHQKIERP